MSKHPHTVKMTPEAATKHFKDLYPYAADGGQTDEFLTAMFKVLLNYVHAVNDPKEPVLDFKHPDDMKKLLDLALPKKGVPLQRLVDDSALALKLQVKTGHHHYFNQLTQGLDIVSMAGEWLTATANTNMFTYELAPVFILMEMEVLKHMRSFIGKEFENGDSIMAPGGSISNLYAFMCARHKHFPNYKKEGMTALPGKLVMFTSDQAHYSVKACSTICGLGIDNCELVPADKQGRMIPAELVRLIEERKKKGHIPFYVSATGGTTVLGAFDPFHEISDICKKYNLWMHVDCAWGGGLLLSKTHRKLLSGIEKADSVTWNPHKLLGALLQCSTVHLKEDGLLLSCNSAKASYLFMPDKVYDVKYDTGDKVIQCGRHNDIFKFWLQWRAKGDEGFEQHIDRLMSLTQYFVKQLKTQKDKFYLIREPVFVNICFWYMPKRLRGTPHTPEKEKEMAKLCPKLKGKLMEEGTVMIGYTPDKWLPNFFRQIISSAATTEADLDFLLSELDRVGHDM